MQSSRGHNAPSLARALGVNRRTIHRDVELLRQSGINVLFDESEQCYRLVGTRLLPPTQFTPEEAMAILVLCHQVAPDIPFYEPATSAALKLESGLPARLREHVGQQTHAVRILIEPINRQVAQNDAIYRQLLEAITGRKNVRLTYDSVAEGEQIQTKLSPYRMLFSRRSWYVIGRSSLHRGLRTFNVARVHGVEPLEDSFHLPRGFSIERYLRNAWHLIPEAGPDREVRLRFAPLVARNVNEVTWHKTQRTQLNADGSLDFTVQVSGLWEISWWIMGYADQVEVLSPPELREMIKGRAENMAKRYA